MSKSKKPAGPWRSRIVGHSNEPPATLRPSPWNWRQHGSVQREVLDQVLRRVGVVQGVVVNRTTGHVVDGHLRIALAAGAGQPTVPVTWVELSEDEERAVLASFDPIAALAGTDEERLAALLAELPEDLAALVGVLHPNDDADTATPGRTDPDALPEPHATSIARGMLFELGAHRLLCGDCTNADDVRRLLQTEQARMLLTDPPYGMDLDTDWSGAIGSLKSIGRQHQTRGKKYARVTGDAAPFDPSHLFAFFPRCREMFLWGADYYAERIPDRAKGSWLVWDKRKESQADAIGSEFELCWSKVKHKRRLLRHDWFGFLSSENGAEARARVHPTQKPSSLLRDILQQWGRADDVVVDPYVGSGTTIIACEQLGYACRALEIEPSYVQLTIDRWEAFTGQTATKLGER